MGEFPRSNDRPRSVRYSIRLDEVRTFHPSEEQVRQGAREDAKRTMIWALERYYFRFFIDLFDFL